MGRRVLGENAGPEDTGSRKKEEMIDVICKYENVTKKLIILHSKTYQEGIKIDNVLEAHGRL